MAWSDGDRTLRLRLADGSQRREPMPRTFRVRVAPEQEAREVVFDGSAMEVQL